MCFQALLQEAHDVEVQKQKQEDKLQRQLAVRKEDRATEVQTVVSAPATACPGAPLTCLVISVQETILHEQVEGLVEDEDEEDAAAPNEDEADSAVAAIAVAEKKTERQRKKEKAEKIKVYLCLVVTMGTEA